MPPRPEVNLDPFAAVLDRLLAHPLAAIARELLPSTVATVEEARDNLPALASGLEARASARVRAEAADLESALLGGVQTWIKDTIRAGKGQAPTRRLKAKTANRKGRTKKGPR